jgi:predicted TIM-barrel fold metal-dependent hydrolase
MVIDVWAQQPNPTFAAQPWLATLLRWTGQERGGLTVDTDATMAAIDRGGVDVALMSAWCGPTGMLISNDDVADLVGRHPARFRGVGTADIRSPAAACRELRRCVNDLGFVAIRVVPWLWNLPPNDRRYYPLYATCVELGVPLCTQIGHTGPLCPSEPGRPIPYLDDVLLEFPELVVVGGHVGYPWIDEVLSLATKYPNFHIDTSTHRPTRPTGSPPPWWSTCVAEGEPASCSAQTGRHHNCQSGATSCRWHAAVNCCRAGDRHVALRRSQSWPSAAGDAKRAARPDSWVAGCSLVPLSAEY